MGRKKGFVVDDDEYSVGAELKEDDVQEDKGLEHAIACTSLYAVGPDDDVGDIKDSAREEMKSVMSRIDRSGVGVYVQASTLGSLEALLEFLKSPAVKIPVSGISIGPVHKKDVMKASVMLEKHKEYGTIMAFDVNVTPEARELADELGVKIFIADIIYHLFDQFKAYIDNLKEEKKKEAADEAVFPCALKIMPDCVFNKKDPIILGVDVLDGTAKGLEHAIAGTSLYAVGPDDDVEDIKDSAREEMKSVMSSRIDRSGVGVFVQASTLGSLEALLEFLKSPAVKIPVRRHGFKGWASPLLGRKP